VVILSTLQRAKVKENDEFHIQLEDVEHEMRYYRKHFKNKIVYLNCDNPYQSDIFKYFALGFNFLRLKKLIVTCQKNEYNEKSYYVEIEQVQDLTGDGSITMEDIWLSFDKNINKISELNGNGDYDSEECIEILKHSDIVITTPPFSSIQRYITMLSEYDKQFIVLGNLNMITYKNVFPLFMDKEIWFGVNNHRPKYFKVPNDTEYLNIEKIDNNGDKYVRLGNCYWVTNLDFRPKRDKMVLYQKYDKEFYPKYDNYNAIEVSKATDIPYDYTGVMGVPISILTNFDYDQFELIGCSSVKEYTGIENYQLSNEFMSKYHAGRRYNNSTPRRSKPSYITTDGLARVCYHRLFIKNKSI